MSLSPDLIWACINKHNSFIVRKNGVTFSREPGNLTNVHSYEFSGLANRTAVDIQPAKEKGAVLSLKTRYGRRPARSWSRVDLKRDFRRGARSIRRSLRGYRRDLTRAALGRW